MDDFRAINKKFYDWVIKSNFYLLEFLNDPNGFFFSGSFCSGVVSNARVLLLSINPGGDPPSRAVLPGSQLPELKYIEECKERNPFAQIMVSNLCVDIPERMASIVESYLMCPFPTPDVESWYMKLKVLPDSLKNELEDIQRGAISILLGLSTVDTIVISGRKNFIDGIKILVSMGYIDKNSKIDDVVCSEDGSPYIRKVVLTDGRSVYGMFHFSRDPEKRLYEATREFCEKYIWG